MDNMYSDYIAEVVASEAKVSNKKHAFWYEQGELVQQSYEENISLYDEVYQGDRPSFHSMTTDEIIAKFYK